jgi:hypothetical protein
MSDLFWDCAIAWALVAVWFSALVLLPFGLAWALGWLLGAG